MSESPGPTLIQLVDLELLIQTCRNLNSNGHLIFLEHDQERKKSILVINEGVILGRVHGCLKAVKRVLGNDIGMMEEKKLEKILSKSLGESMEPSLAKKYFLFTQFCTEISPKSLISVPDRMEDVKHYLFPSLNNADRPSLNEAEGDSYTKWLTWCLKCRKSHHFFTPRFLHTLIIQLAKCDKDIISTKFTAWRNGILLVSGKRTRSVIEVTEQTTRVYLSMQCREGYESHLVKQRSMLISLIKSLALKVCPHVKAKESFLLPQSTYPPSDETVIAITDLAKSAVADDPAVVYEVDKTRVPREMAVEEILLFDSFHSVENDTLKNIFSRCHLSQTVPLGIIEDVVSSVECCRELAKRISKASQKASSGITYSQLYEELAQFTVYTDGSLYVSIQIIILCSYGHHSTTSSYKA